MRVRTLFAIITLILGIKANATTYYFSSSQGDDSRSSSQAQDPSTPWKTLAKLNAWFPYLQPGDRVLFKCGETFYGSIETTKSGTSSSPIVLSSYGKGVKPTISGFTTVTGWTAVGNGIYESNTLPTGSAVNMVTIKDKQYAMGRYPNAGSANGGYLSFESHGYNTITDNEETLSSDWNGAQLVIRTTRFLLERSTITGISGNTITYGPTSEYGLIDKFGYFVQNSIKTLDQYGEWYYNPITKTILVYFGNKSPLNTPVQVSSVDILVTAHSSNIVLDNISLSGANKYGLYNDYAGIDNLKINNSKIAFSGIDAIALAGTNNFVLQGSTLLNSNSNGIDLFYANNNAVIKTTTIQNTATFPGMLIPDEGRNRFGMGIYASQGLTAINNSIINTGFIGINFEGNNNLIQNNYINTFCTILDDGAGIYTFGGKSNPINFNRKIVGNIVLNGIGARAGAYSSDPNYNPAEGIYLDDNATNVEVTGNTAAYCGHAGIYVHNARGMTLHGNKLFDNYVQLAFQHDATGDKISGGVIMQNQAFSKSASQLVMMLQSRDNDFAGIGIFDSNYYCRPFKEEGINYTNWFYNKEGYYNLSGWQSSYNKDWNTKKTPVTISDTSDILFQYNASTSTKTITLNGTYTGLNNVIYTGSIALEPYTSIILLKTSNSSKSASGNMTTSASAIANTNVKGAGYVNSESATFTVKAYPNPSSYYFNVTTQGSNTNEPVTLRVIDLAGRLVQVKTGITTNSTLQVGHDLRPGSYILELIQGNKKVEQKLIKLSK